jgi:UDP-N-acetylmuramate dehydrogenase
MRYLHDQPLKKHTAFRIGGPADHLCVPKNVDELQEALRFAKERRLRVVVLGAGTNTLALDRGFRGMVIKLAGSLGGIELNRSRARVGAGVLLPRLMNRLAQKGLSGLEFLAGIPGSVGGAVVMNAGAWGKSIGERVEEVRVLDNKGRLKPLKKGELGFGYRRSRLQGRDWIVIEVALKLRRQKKRLIKEKLQEYLARRKATQPLGIPNSGSIFKNPKGRFAGKLIEEAGCKGMRVGDAQVSAKHGNFIVNLGDAKARDVIKLMTRVQKAVSDKFKIMLEPEIKIMIKSTT